MVGSIRESAWEYECIVYAKFHKIHREYGWTYIGCKRCGRVAKPLDEEAEDSSTNKAQSSKAGKANEKLWHCRVHKKITAVGPKYKVIVRVIDDTGSASLLLFDDMINTLVGVPCYKLKEQYGPDAEEMFPEELSKGIVGKRLLFRFTYTEWNINNNHHIYQVSKMSDDAEYIKLFKKDFIKEDYDPSFETPIASADGNSASSSILRFNASVPFNLEDTPQGKDTGEKSSESGSGSSGKRTIIDLDDFDNEDYEARQAKKPLLPVKIEKE